MLAGQRCHRTQNDLLPCQQKDFPPGGEERESQRFEEERQLQGQTRESLEVSMCNWGTLREGLDPGTMCVKGQAFLI